MLRGAARPPWLRPAAAAWALAALSAGPLGCAGSRACRGPGVEVLGSGGPIPDDARASAGYLVRDGAGRGRVLVDAGGGVFVRYAEAGARLADLEVVALTHLHADHTSDLPALLKGAYFGGPRPDLVVAGPSGGGLFPGTGDFLRRLFGPDAGAYRYLSWLLVEGEGPFGLDVREVDAAARSAVPVHRAEGIEVSAVGVVHGPVPAVAYRVEVDGAKVVFAGDAGGGNDHLADFARGADVLVMHHAVPESARGIAARLHARPSEIGRIAAASGVPVLVLSHHMARSLADLPAALRTIRRAFPGRVVVARDHTCVPLPRPPG